MWSVALIAKLKRFQAKHALGLDPGVGTGSREENAPKQVEPRFWLNQNREGSAISRLRRTDLAWLAMADVMSFVEPTWP